VCGLPGWTPLLGEVKGECRSWLDGAGGRLERRFKDRYAVHAAPAAILRMEPRRALSPPDLDPPASSVAALQLLHGVLHCNLTYTKTARSCVPLLRRTSCANARRTRPASALRLQVTGHPQHNRRIDQREPPAGWDLAPKQRCRPGPPTPEPAGGAESSVPPRSVHAGRSWVDDRPLTPVVLHARSATASRLSHKTYNKYREPLLILAASRQTRALTAGHVGEA